MNRLRATWRFRRALRQKRFAEAVAAHEQGALRARAESYWAQYRLGLYATVARRVDEEGVPDSPWALLAALCSLAAIGRNDAAGGYLRRLPAAARSSPRWRQRVAAALAPHDPGLALSWLDADAPDAGLDYPDLLAALLLATGQEGRAATLLERALSAGQDSHYPELLLHAANLAMAGTPSSAEATAAALGKLNGFLAHHGLEPIARRDGARPLSAANAVASAPPCAGERPLVSVIMTAYRTADRIGPALDSLLRQSHRNLQVIVMDDASDDDLGEQVVPVTQRDGRVSYVRLPHNAGPYVAKELALRDLAKGEFVTCHDSDDWSHPRKIEQQLDWLLQARGRVFCWSQWLRLSDEGRITVRQCHPLLRNNLSSTLFRRQAVLERAGGYDQVRTGADSEFLARLLLVFGREGGGPLRKPLSLGAMREGSLMSDRETGISGSGTTPFRLDYWEAWRRWHLDCLRAGRLPVMPPPGAPRPFPVAEMQLAAAEGALAEQAGPEGKGLGAMPTAV